MNRYLIRAIALLAMLLGAPTASAEDIRIHAHGKLLARTLPNVDLLGEETIGCRNPEHTARWVWLMNGRPRQEQRGAQLVAVTDDGGTMRNNLSWFYRVYTAEPVLFNNKWEFRCHEIPAGPGVAHVESRQTFYGVEMVCVNKSNWHETNCLWIAAIDVETVRPAETQQPLPKNEE
jgi:hypothetical protein